MIDVVVSINAARSPPTFRISSRKYDAVVPASTLASRICALGGYRYCALLSIYPIHRDRSLHTIHPPTGHFTVRNVHAPTWRKQFEILRSTVIDKPRFIHNIAHRRRRWFWLKRRSECGQENGSENGIRLVVGVSPLAAYSSPFQLIFSYIISLNIYASLALAWNGIRKTQSPLKATIGPNAIT